MSRIRIVIVATTTGTAIFQLSKVSLSPIDHQKFYLYSQVHDLRLSKEVVEVLPEVASEEG